MHDNFDVEPAVLKAKLTSETAQINWHELQRFYAAGSVLQVSSSLDLVDVAYAFAIDDKTHVAAWLQAGQLQRVDEQSASHWYEQQQALWAVVVSPWVLVQLPKTH